MIAVDVQSKRVSWPFRILLAIALLLLAHAIWDFVEARRLRRRLETVVSRGEPTSTVKYVQSTGGAAESDRLYRAAAALVSGASEEPPELRYRLAQALRDGQWTSDVIAFARSLVERHAEALGFADRAASLPFENFLPGTQFNYLTGSLGALSRLCEVRAAVRALDGQADAAADSLYSDARLSRTLSRLRPFTALPFVFNRSRPSPSATAKLSVALADLDRDDFTKQDVVRMRAALLTAAGNDPMRNAPWIARPWLAHRLTSQLDIYADLIAAADRPAAERVSAMNAVGAFPTMFAISPERGRIELEAYTRGLASTIDALHCARRIVAGEATACRF